MTIFSVFLIGCTEEATIQETKTSEPGSGLETSEESAEVVNEILAKL